jgi:hypothetical protein
LSSPLEDPVSVSAANLEGSIRAAAVDDYNLIGPGQGLERLLDVWLFVVCDQNRSRSYVLIGLGEEDFGAVPLTVDTVRLL